MPVREGLRVDLEAVAEQDDDQRDARHVAHELLPDVEMNDARGSLPEQEACEREQRRQRQQAAVRDPGGQRADHQQPAEREQ